MGSVNISVETIITIAAVIGALVAIMGYYNKVYEFVRRSEAQSEELRGVKDEQTLLTYGVLACLKGLKEQGCDGPVTEAIDKIEKHLNVQAHS